MADAEAKSSVKDPAVAEDTDATGAEAASAGKANVPGAIAAHAALSNADAHAIEGTAIAAMTGAGKVASAVAGAVAAGAAPVVDADEADRRVELLMFAENTDASESESVLAEAANVTAAGAVYTTVSNPTAHVPEGGAIVAVAGTVPGAGAAANTAVTDAA